MTIIDKELLRKTDKRQAIIEAAKELFVTQGYENTTIAQVAKEARVAVGTVYLYFKNKLELLWGVQEYYEMQFAESISQPLPIEIPFYLRLRPLVERCFELGREQCDMLQFIKMQPQLVGDRLEMKSSLIQGAIEVFIKAGIEEGSFRDVDPHAAAVVSFGMVNHGMEQCFEIENGENTALYIETIADCVERWALTPEIYQRLQSERASK